MLPTTLPAQSAAPTRALLRQPALFLVLMLVLLLAVTAVLTPLTGAHAQAEAPAEDVRVVIAAASGRAGNEVLAAADVTRDGAPAAGVVVRWERATSTGWTAVATTTSDRDGRSTVPLVVARSASSNQVRARVETGDENPSAWAFGTVTIVRAPTTVALSAPATVVDERSGTLTVAWRTDRDEGVRGTVTLQRRVKRPQGWSQWATFRTLTTTDAGTASTVVTPRWSHRWRVLAPHTEWTTGATSAQSSTRNVAPGKAVKMPKGAPRPRIRLGVQPRAVGAGANVQVSRIPDTVWRSMKGVSWRRGCPVGRRDLRLVETNYWAFDGYRRRGRVVVAAVVVDNFTGVFTDMHAARVPIRSLRLPDRFGRSKRLGGADDLRSMAADNTSAFNCRGVVGSPGRRSPHAWGRSLDLNPWENPYRSSWGVVPNRWWMTRAHRDVAWRSSSHRVVKIMARNGFRWTYGHGDLHHFDAVPGRARTARALAQDASLAAAVAACAPHCD